MVVLDAVTKIPTFIILMFWIIINIVLKGRARIHSTTDYNDTNEGEGGDDDDDDDHHNDGNSSVDDDDDGFGDKLIGSGSNYKIYDAK